MIKKLVLLGLAVLLVGLSTQARPWFVPNTISIGWVNQNMDSSNFRVILDVDGDMPTTVNVVSYAYPNWSGSTLRNDTYSITRAQLEAASGEYAVYGLNTGRNHVITFSNCRAQAQVKLSSSGYQVQNVVYQLTNPNIPPVPRVRPTISNVNISISGANRIVSFTTETCIDATTIRWQINGVAAPTWNNSATATYPSTQPAVCYVINEWGSTALTVLPNGTWSLGAQDGTFSRSSTGPNADIVTVGNQTVSSVPYYVVGGSFSSIDGAVRGNLARFNVDGSLSSWAPTAGGAVNSLVVQADGKVVVGMSASPWIRRFNTDGTVDTTFAAANFNGSVYTIVERSDGKLFVGGDFTSANSIQAYRIILLTANGATDSNFSPFYGCNGPILAILPEEDGRVIVGGAFSSIGPGLTRNNFGRFTSGGNYDATFAVGGGANGVVYALARQNDGNILLAGSFSTVNGSSLSKIARVNVLGAVDSTFKPGVGPNDIVKTMAIQPDGRIIIGGAFTTYNSISQNRVARISPYGALDPYFDIGTGANNQVYGLLKTGIDKIVAVGAFTSFNGVANVRIQRLHGN
jgi:uncharacterized delta-60 repeat protein